MATTSRRTTATRFSGSTSRKRHRFSGANSAPKRWRLFPTPSIARSKATGPAGGYLVPQDFVNLVTSARRAQGVIGELARQIETDHGRPIPLPAATSHGTASWVAENAAAVASDETFVQVVLNAYKAAAHVIVSEELSQDSLENATRVSKPLASLLPRRSDE